MKMSDIVSFYYYFSGFVSFLPNAFNHVRALLFADNLTKKKTTNIAQAVLTHVAANCTHIKKGISTKTKC